MFKFYEVGGKARDEILGLQSNDVDYVAVPEESLLEKYTEAHEMFVIPENYLLDQGFQIFLSTIKGKIDEETKEIIINDIISVDLIPINDNLLKKEFSWITVK